MKNFLSGAVSGQGDHNKLCVKVFAGKPDIIEKEIQKFIDDEPIKIIETRQSESQSDGDSKITITLFYYSEGKVQFIDERWTINLLTSKMLDELESMYGITFDDIWNTMVKKQKK